MSCTIVIYNMSLLTLAATKRDVHTDQQLMHKPVHIIVFKFIVLICCLVMLILAPFFSGLPY